MQQSKIMTSTGSLLTVVYHTSVTFYWCSGHVWPEFDLHFSFPIVVVKLVNAIYINVFTSCFCMWQKPLQERMVANKNSKASQGKGCVYWVTHSVERTFAPPIKSWGKAWPILRDQLRGLLEWMDIPTYQLVLHIKTQLPCMVVELSQTFQKYALIHSWAPVKPLWT